MIKEARGFGSSIIEAQENARLNLGAAPDADVQFETITQGKKKVLGIFGGCRAEVRAYIETADAKPKKEKKNDGAKKGHQPSKPEKKEVSGEKKPAVKVKPQVTVSDKDFGNAVDESEISADSKTGKAIKYLREILSDLGCENIKIKANETAGGAFIILDGEGLGVIIGHRGETLDALQYLTSLAANNGGGYFKVSLNIGDFREKREETLTRLAQRVSAQVLKSGRSRALEPMNPYERRIIHTAVQNIEGVISNSVGEGAARRVVIAPEGAEIKPHRNGRSGARRDSRGKRESAVVSTAPAREPKKDTDVPLYGKLN